MLFLSLSVRSSCGNFPTLLSPTCLQVYTLSCLANQRDPRTLALVELLGKASIQILVRRCTGRRKCHI